MPKPFHRRQFLLMSAVVGGISSHVLWNLLRQTGSRDTSAEQLVPGLKQGRRTSRALGTSISLLALHEDKLVIDAAFTAAFGELELIESLMSIYRPESQLSQLNRTGLFERPHPCFVEVLEASQAMAKRSNGAFDVTVQPLWDLYAAAQLNGKLPDAAAIENARIKVDWRKLEVRPEHVRLWGKDMSVTLNGIAQGYAADRVLAVLRAHGIVHALVNTGEIGTLGNKNGSPGCPWSVGIQHPRHEEAYLGIAMLNGGCLATSGDYEIFFSADRTYNHIFDPATGRSPEAFSSVSVAASSGMDADALSTAIFVTGMERGVRLVEETPGAHALFVCKDGTQLATKGFPISPL